MPTQTVGRKRKFSECFLTDSHCSQSEHVVDINRNISLKATMFEVIDSLVAELDARFVNMHRLDWVKLFQPTNFDNLKTARVTVVKLVNELVNFNHHFIGHRESFGSQLHMLCMDTDLRTALGDGKEPASSLKKMRNLDLCDTLSEISNASTACLTISLTNVTYQRNFSVRHRLETYLHSIMNHERPKHLMLLNTESDLMKELLSYPTFTDIIDRFAAMKDRHISLIYKK